MLFFYSLVTWLWLTVLCNEVTRQLRKKVCIQKQKCFEKYYCIITYYKMYYYSVLN